MRLKNPNLIFRLGLAFVFIYAGIGSLTNPDAWIGYVPNFVGNLIPKETFLMVHGVGELLIAAGILFNVVPKIVYVAASLALLGILVTYGVDGVTFRDVGLLALSLGLWVEAMYKPTQI